VIHYGYKFAPAPEPGGRDSPGVPVESPAGKVKPSAPA